MIDMASKALEHLAALLRERRSELRMTQEQLAKAAGVPKGTIGSIEACNLKGPPTLPTLSSLEKGLQLPTGYLIAIANGRVSSQGMGGVNPRELAKAFGTPYGKHYYTPEQYRDADENLAPAPRPMMNDEEAQAFLDTFETLSPEARKVAMEHLLFLKHRDSQAKE